MKDKRRPAKDRHVRVKNNPTTHITKAQSAKKEEPVASSSAAITRPLSIVGIGASAGGLEAFEDLLAALPSDSGMAFVLVQHLAPTRDSILSELLSKSTVMPVIEVTEGTTVDPNKVFVIPPNAEMSIVNGILHLSPLSPDRTRRMPIDLFLRSLAEDQHGRAIGVILSGTASDGTLGIQAIKAMGGVTFAQDDDTAKYNAMPRNAVAGGNVDFVLPPHLIARELRRIASHVHLFPPDELTESPEPPAKNDAIARIYNLLQNFSRVDFSQYKPGTIKRRITRRMFLRKIDNLESYLQFLRKNADEVEALFNDVLINVTGFFRDAEVFEALRGQAFPSMMRNKTQNSPLRVWVPGCSTGEEAYSIAIALLEFLGERSASLQVQIFATDVSEGIIQRARLGFYPESIGIDVSAERLKRFFQRTDGGYQIGKMVRDICIFAKQDLGKDPPFSRLDMISCRNVMIYMGPLLQRRIIPLFHYALNEGGILLLGSSETVGGFTELFSVADKKHKIYAKKVVDIPLTVEFPRLDREPDVPKRPEPISRDELQKHADQILLNRYVPASVVVNDKLDIVQFIGQTGKFLDPTPGDASLHLLKLVKGGLQIELRLAFERFKRTGIFRKEGVLMELNGVLKTVNFEIIPIKNAPGKERYYLVIFEEGKSVHDTSRPPQKAEKTKSAKGKPSDVGKENVHLREELEATREYLQSIIEEQRTTNEELRSANEEIQSSNEELQSINEELETAKEELQSTNEELTTVNEELQNRNEELSRVNNDLNNLLSSVNIPIIMLGNDLRIRRFTPVAEKVMNLIPSDLGRPVTDIKTNLRIHDLRESVSRVVDTLEIHESEVEDTAGKRYSMRIRPYRTVDNKIDGVVVVLFELDSRPRLKQS